MPKMVMRRRIQLDKLMIGTIDVGEEELAGSITAADIADVGDGCLEIGAVVELFLVGSFHILRAPADVPDRRRNLRLGGLPRFVEEHPRFLRPNGVDLVPEASLFAVELAGVEIDGLSRVRGVEV